jgi:nitrate reductase molybdenum cofactor assembly chaperone NarJ/NarW
MPIQQDQRAMFRLFSALLSYPDASLMDSLEDFRRECAGFAECNSTSKLNHFFETLETIPLMAIQESYTSAFDFSADTCLYLTYHEHGEARERGAALSKLRQLYKAEGYEQLNSELPDYLPIVLEFLSVCSDETASIVLRNHISHISILTERLKHIGHPYGCVMESLLLSCRELISEGE